MNRMFSFLSLLLVSSLFSTNVEASIVITTEDFDGSGPSWNNDISQFFFTDPNSGSNQGLFTIDAAQAAATTVETNANFSGDVLYARDLLGESNDVVNGQLQSLSPFTFTFDTIDVSNFTDVEISFDYAVFAGLGVLGPVDEGFYEVFVDGVGLGRTNYFTSDNFGNTARDSGTIVANIGTAQTVSLVLTGSLDGNTDTLQLDNFTVTGHLAGIPEPMTAATFLISMGLIYRRRRS